MNKVAVVSGANQGLGLALVRKLCQQLGADGTVYLTARDPERGRAAVKQLEAEGLAPQFHVLDVTDDASVTDLARLIQEKYGGIDLVLSNAAARLDPNLSSAQQVRTFVNTNNFGTHRLLQTFSPLLKDGARFVVVASSFGSLRHLPAQLHAKFEVEHLTLADLERVMKEYVQTVEAGRAEAEGWPDWINLASKIGQVAAVKVMARSMREEAARRHLMIAAACPGLVNTAASRPWFTDMSQAQSPDEAAKDIVWLATLSDKFPEFYGELIQHRRVLPFR